MYISFKIFVLINFKNKVPYRLLLFVQELHFGSKYSLKDSKLVSRNVFKPSPIFCNSNQNFEYQRVICRDKSTCGSCDCIIILGDWLYVATK